MNRCKTNDAEIKIFSINSRWKQAIPCENWISYCSVQWSISTGNLYVEVVHMYFWDLRLDTEWSVFCLSVTLSWARRMIFLRLNRTSMKSLSRVRKGRKRWLTKLVNLDFSLLFFLHLFLHARRRFTNKNSAFNLYHESADSLSKQRNRKIPMWPVIFFQKVPRTVSPSQLLIFIRTLHVLSSPCLSYKNSWERRLLSVRLDFVNSYQGYQPFSLNIRRSLSASIDSEWHSFIVCG